MEKKKLNHDDYTVAWICPLEVEQVAALEMLDEEHQRLPQPENDHNAYNLGSVSNHNVVIAGLPTTGNCSAATVVAQMRNTYPRLRFGLLVGIGGGVPVRTEEGPIRLGHIVVSQPVGQHSGAVQYNHGKAEANEFVRTGFLAPPPAVLLNAARELQVSRRRVSVDPLVCHLERIDTTKRGLRNFKRPQTDQDHLYEPDYIHLEKGKSCNKCGCEASKRVDRDGDDSDDDSTSETDDNWLVVHRGTIASGEVVMRNGIQRDALARDHKILCFEMEAAGALNDFPCLVIRGISDYSDSHKNDKWHGYAAAVAAAYARELFQHMPVEEVKQCRIAETDVKKLVKNTQETAGYILDSRVKDWLKPSDASVNLANASNLRHLDTGRWFLESDRYRWLKSTPGASLWLRGMPGCGKTVLSSTIIEDLKLDNEITGTAIIYFFFSFSDDSKQKLDYMLRSLIFQLIGWNESTKVHLLKLFEDSRRGDEQPQTTQLAEVFSQMVSELQDVIVVLDALDESKDRRDLLRWITSSSGRTCKFVLTSRSERDIEACFASWLSPNDTMTLGADFLGDDIEAYIHYRLKEDEHLSRWKSMHGEITSALLGKAAGMFRWVYCQLQELSECLDKSAVRRFLRTLPNDLNETYDRILEKVPGSRAPDAIKLLQLLTFSKRPLRLEEVIDAVATDPDAEPHFDIANRVIPPDTIIGYCSSLVSISTASKETFADEVDKGPRGGPEFLTLPWKLRSSWNEEEEESIMIQLAHSSVRQYLLLDRQKNPYHDYLEEKRANAAITRIYLLYLWTAAKLPRARLWRFNYPLAGLAATYWLEHARIAGDNEEFCSLWTNKLFADHAFVQYWLSIYRPDRHASLDHLPPAPCLYYASLAGLYHTVKELLDTGAGIASTGYGYDDALQAACRSGSMATVKLLLESGAMLKFEGDSLESPIYKAAVTGNVELLHLLLIHGAHSDSKNLEIGYPMHAAAENGDLGMMQMLIEYGADVNVRRPYAATQLTRHRGEFVLHIAAAKDRTDIVKMLLDCGASVNSHDKEIKRTALHVAAHHGYIKTVQVLLGHGADIDAKDRFGYTALHIARARGHLNLFDALLQQGADINACSTSSIWIPEEASRSPALLLARSYVAHHVL
ncbi:ankyrin repeat protein, partial [Aureobasidium melanogenum]